MKTKRLFIGLSIFVIATVAGWIVAKYIIFPQEKKDISNDINKKVPDVTAEEYRAIRISLPLDGSIIDEVIYVQKKSLPIEIAEVSIKEYIKRFQDDLKNTELFGIYMDRNNNVYIDFSGSIRSDLNGDMKKEYLLLKGIYKTITNNISDVEDVKVLIDGKEVDTICGHLYILYGLRDVVGIDE
jgi:hypothetical protein